MNKKYSPKKVVLAVSLIATGIVTQAEAVNLRTNQNGVKSIAQTIYSQEQIPGTQFGCGFTCGASCGHTAG